jgi:hypothetical protein
MGDLSVDDFCAWLALHEYDVVGRLGMCFHSPLALWLSERLGVVVGVDETVYGPACMPVYRWRPLPRWAVLFEAYATSQFTRVVTGLEAFLLLAAASQ